MKKVELLKIRRALATRLAQENPDLTQCDIAEILSVTQAAVCKWLSRVGIARRRGLRRKENVRYLAKTYPELSQKELGDWAGVSQPMVSRWLKGVRRDV